MCGVGMQNGVQPCRHADRADLPHTGCTTSAGFDTSGRSIPLCRGWLAAAPGRGRWQDAVGTNWREARAGRWTQTGCHGRTNV